MERKPLEAANEPPRVILGRRDNPANSGRIYWYPPAGKDTFTICNCFKSRDKVACVKSNPCSRKRCKSSSCPPTRLALTIDFIASNLLTLSFISCIFILLGGKYTHKNLSQCIFPYFLIKYLSSSLHLGHTQLFFKSLKKSYNEFLLYASRIFMHTRHHSATRAEASSRTKRESELKRRKRKGIQSQSAATAGMAR